MDDLTSRAPLILVFSKDRPLQLDATLRSLELNCEDLELAEIHVLYKTSAPRFAAGYRVLATGHPGVAFHREVDLKADLVRLVNGSDYVLFLVDDTLFVGGLSLAAGIGVLQRDPTCLGFSYRLGRNTTYCYTLDKPQRLPAFEGVDSGILAFDWTEADHDFGYPIEVSSSIYRTSDVLPLLRDLDYRNPNTLETVLSERAASFGTTRPRLASYGQSVALSVPANLVQTAWDNRVDGRADLSAEALARRYDAGDRLDVDHYRGFIANACHQEVEFVFKKDPTIPTVSVVTRCFNQAQYLPNAVHSVAEQTFTDWEIVIVDDGSPDDTADVARRLAAEIGERVRLVSQANAGLSGAMNAGVTAARGRYILPLDADDMIARTMLEVGVALLETRLEIAIAYPDMQQFGDSSRMDSAGVWDVDWLCWYNQLNYCSLYRREVWDAVGGYNPNMVFGYEDWDFWIGCAETGFKGQRIPQPLFLYRVRPGTMASRALAHHLDLLQQIRRNHPRQFTAIRRAQRRLRTRPRSVPRWAVRRILRSLGSR